MDLLWLYILIVVLVVGAIIAGILCCCLAKENDEIEAMHPKDDDQGEQSRKDKEQRDKDAAAENPEGLAPPPVIAQPE